MIVAKIGFSPFCGLVIIVYHVLNMGGSLLLEQKPSLHCGEKGCQQASLVTLRDHPTLLHVKKELTNEWLSKLRGALGIESTDFSTR